MKKMLSCVISAVSLIAGISVISIPISYAKKENPAIYTDAEMTEKVEHTVTKYEVNKNGQTFGMSDTAYVEDLPDLISAMGDNGNLGYIYASELFKSPSSPEEALAYQNKLDNGEYTPRVINVYKSDGKTVIDTLTETLPD